MDYAENDYFVVHSKKGKNEKISAPSLVLEFEGDAPFAYIRSAGKQAQFRCVLRNTKKENITDTEFGSVYFVAAVSPPDSSVSFYHAHDNERYRYQAYLYRTLRARLDTNSDREFSLINDEYEDINCYLVGVQMFPPFVYSNDLRVKKTQVIGAYAKFLSDRTDSGVQTLDEFLEKQRR